MPHHTYPHTIVNGAGETLTLLRRVPGRTGDRPEGENFVWNAGEDELHCTGYIEPADNVEYLLSRIFESQRRNGGKRPHLLDAAYLARRYCSEYSILEIPIAVQRLLFPVLVAIGTLLGRYRQYRNAPEPVTR